jgi:hypothetical protein
MAVVNVVDREAAIEHQEFLVRAPCSGGAGPARGIAGKEARGPGPGVLAENLYLHALSQAVTVVRPPGQILRLDEFDVGPGQEALQSSAVVVGFAPQGRSGIIIFG